MLSKVSLFNGITKIQLQYAVTMPSVRCNFAPSGKLSRLSIKTHVVYTLHASSADTHTQPTSSSVKVLINITQKTTPAPCSPPKQRQPPTRHVYQLCSLSLTLYHLTHTHRPTHSSDGALKLLHIRSCAAVCSPRRIMSKGIA